MESEKNAWAVCVICERKGRFLTGIELGSGLQNIRAYMGLDLVPYSSKEVLIPS